MKSAIDITWVDFYKEFAEKLLEYHENRKGLIEKIKKVYIMTEIKLPTLERNNDLTDIDPFTVFGLFNKSSLSLSNKIKILKAIAELFEIKADLPNSFESIPTVNNMGATFYYFKGDRNADDIDELWRLFKSALEFAKYPTTASQEKFIEYFDKVMSKKGIHNSKLTSGLYWIAPEKFINLDSRSRWYIYESGEITGEIINKLPIINGKLSGEVYIEIIVNIQNYLSSRETMIDNFIKLSYEAWRYSEEINLQKKNKDIEIETTDADKDVESMNYWMFSPGSQAVNWDAFYEKGIMSIGWEELEDFSMYMSRGDMKEKIQEINGNTNSYINITNAIWQFTNEMKIGDIVYVKKGQKQIIGWGIVTSEHEYHPRQEFKNIRTIEWKDKGEWITSIKPAPKTLTNITPYNDFVENLKILFEEDKVDIEDETEASLPTYDRKHFLNDVFMEEEDYLKLVNLLRRKKNVILQGAPGVGKTFVAKRLAYSMMGLKDKKRVQMVQFHQNYSYEDFVMGFRPTESGFELRKGTFYNFCKRAENDIENDYFFIIDEINRGNLSKILGELFMLIENDKRGTELQLLYADEKFSVPPNIYILGMMNTADRSLAMLDYALRRRFAFYNMTTGFMTTGFSSYQEKLASAKFDSLIQCILNLNSEIKRDESLGEGFIIGHSYFCNLSNVTDYELENIVEYEIIPLINEYWFDEPDKVDSWSGKLRGAIQ
ncbi:AAA family ATPase [Staphylococcus saprophyticus]|uniref:AAA family ATPase n=1 Tax=Staphylococcus saprophyticus TaxID=29385 RepID=UPI0019D06652|nr:AAA family ATPase [Staphylococcus saprophyticus]MBN6204767.1 AAA family ATPase [Staphylococcus saprophyticus]